MDYIENTSAHHLKFGLARMHYETGERRDFLPDFVARMQQSGAEILIEEGYGSGMGYSVQDYLHAASQIHIGSAEEVFQQDYILVLRCPPEAQIRKMKPGACLISMLHYPTRPQRMELLQTLGLEAVSLDTVRDDTGRRLVENLRSVAWNGTEAAFDVLVQTYPDPGFEIARAPTHPGDTAGSWCGGYPGSAGRGALRQHCPPPPPGRAGRARRAGNYPGI